MRKQNADNAYFTDLWANIRQHISRNEVADLATETLSEMEVVTRGKRAAVAWSGGKDSLALYHLAQALGITAGVLGLCHLEYPQLERWYRQNTPTDVQTIRTPQDLAFLRDNPEMLFPETSALLSRWYQIKQIRAQEIYCEREGVEVLLVGRRREEGNYIGPGPNGTHQKRGSQTVIYCPLRDWTHAQVLGLLHYSEIGLPPNYYWPHGFTIGSGSWPVNNFAKMGLNGWQYVYERNPSVVIEAASVLPSAQAFLRSLGV